MYKLNSAALPVQYVIYMKVKIHISHKQFLIKKKFIYFKKYSFFFGYFYGRCVSLQIFKITYIKHVVTNDYKWFTIVFS